MNSDQPRVDVSHLTYPGALFGELDYAARGTRITPAISP